MLKLRRISMGLAAGAALSAVCALLWVAPADGQVKRPIRPVPLPLPPQPPILQPPPSEGGSQFSAIKLVEKSEYRQYINVAQDCIRDKAWNDAVTALQVILDNKEDYYVKVKHRDPKTHRESERWTSVKFEANNLLGSMPDEGLDVYDLRFGARARERLDEAKKKGDLQLLADVAQRYLHTKVGAEANDLLATYFLDRGQFFMAALRFERLLALNPKRVPVSDLTLFKTALAYRRAGDVKSAEQTWERLSRKLADKGGLQVGDQFVGLDKLQQALETIPRPEVANPHDWPLIRGNVTNSAQATGSPPLLDEVLWKRPTIQDKSEITGEEDPGTQAKTWIDRALQRANGQPNTPVLPGFFPIAAGGKLIYRTYNGISSVYLKDGKEADGTPFKAGTIHWKSTELEGPLAAVLNNVNLRNTLENWLQQYQPQAGFLDLVYENSMVGTLSTDQRQVYAVDDLAVPIPPHLIRQVQFNPGIIPAEVKPLVMQNSLHAYDLATGKEVWHLGAGGGNGRKKDDFADSHFLGAPLPVGGKLYVLNEKNNGELFLVCLDPATGSVLPPMQMLGTIEQNSWVTHDLSRRINAVNLGYGEGILVCPTNAGQVLGVDLLSRSLAWAYPYREKSDNQQVVNPFQPFRPQPFPQMPMTMTSANWHNAPPVIAEGKVVFTAPDAHSVHCINLRDGTPSWKRGQVDGELFLAGVFDGKVLIVGKNSVRARRLSDGEQLWELPTGDVPSGQGVASKNVYYLPLKKGEIVAIDMERGLIKAHNRASKSDVPAPGNLVFYEGAVLSQTPLDVVAYPQLSARLEVASAALAQDPDNLEKMTVRGELRLADGQVQGAVTDLRAVMAKNPPPPLLPRVRAKLYDAMTDLFQTDFDQASGKYLDEYRELCRVPDNGQEEQQRQARFLRIMGQGREKQGNLVEAFQAYRDFGALPINREGGVPVQDDPAHKIPTHVWLRGRISAMIARATPEQRQPLEDKIAEEWKGVRGKNEVDAIRNFVGMFDVPFTVGREARLQLADAIIDRNDRGSFLEAELSLEQLRTGDWKDDARVGGRALEALARLEVRKGDGQSMKLAASYYRLLGRQFPREVLREGKTGADLFNDLATDKRFLPYLGQSGSLWPDAKIEARELPGRAVDARMVGFLFQPEGDLTPAARQQRLVLDPSNNNDPLLSLVDMTDNKVRWSQRLGLVQANYKYFEFLYNHAQNNLAYQPNARFRFYQVKGHLAVIQIGTMAYGIDTDSPKLLWQHSLAEVNQPPAVQAQQVMPDQDGNLQMVLWNQFNGQRNVLRLGQVGAVQASYVALLRQKSLVVLDPLKGTTLWTKNDMPLESNIHVFGDDQHIYVVDVTGGNAGAGRAYRASDGAPVEVPDFGYVFQHRLRLEGRKLLSATPGRDGLVLRLYDPRTGKDDWAKTFDAKAVVLQTENPGLTGVIEPNGKMIVVNAHTGEDVLQTEVIQGRVTADDVKNLKEPLLLEDAEHYYVALNRPVDPAQAPSGILNNFGNGLRCSPVNGWFLAFCREDGERKTKDRTITWKKGELDWHSYAPITNQMIVLEQFHNLPVLLFSARYNQAVKGGLQGHRWVSVTQSIDKRTGKMIYDPVNPRLANAVGTQFYAFSLDLKSGTVNMIGHQGVLQHYIDDGRKRPADEGAPVGAAAPPAVAPGVQPQFPPPPPGARGAFAPGGNAQVIIQAVPAVPGQLPAFRPRIRVEVPAQR